MFETASRRRSAVGPIAGLTLFVAGLAIWQAGVLSPEPALPAPTRVERSVAVMLAQPERYGERLSRQIIGEMELLLFRVEDPDVYLSLPREGRDDAELRSVRAEVLDQPDLIEEATEDDGRLYIGNRRRPGTAAELLWFKTPLANLRAPADRTVTFDVGAFTYAATLAELSNLVRNRTVRGGPWAFEPHTAARYPNHGAWVATPDAPSLRRLVDDIVGDEKGREARIQRILDFVTTDIAYEPRPALGRRDTLQRPSETLVTGLGDRSNKTILAASPLVQLGESVRLAYAREHIAPAVPRGAFPVRNRLTLTFEGEELVMLETTVRGFRIGHTRYDTDDPVAWVQNLDDEGLVFDYDTREPVPFAP
ncbi:MAG: hypothetical protein AAF211_25780 [Myxococcota bacterium]